MCDGGECVQPSFGFSFCPTWEQSVQAARRLVMLQNYTFYCIKMIKILQAYSLFRRRCAVQSAVQLLLNAGAGRLGWWEARSQFSVVVSLC